MAKLTKTQRKDLERALLQAEKASAYIMRDSTLVCAPDFKGKPYRSDQFYNEDQNLCIVNLEKRYGSELCQLQESIATLKRFLDNN
ncbi:hypothetical protein VPIG_00061 [Vibrio phage PWH3a-P1]|uniref:hypothetical protein n=1 Tax=Vibrio phage PWH3a-P1 TaxID=754058 RepID=UPI0002C05007|nr:hypothetical protein VPIG_00061 [Vibrio phage PWH3a-P1]AGH31919.1 hypothetical protein VPIG_00061 [Vibrio phage PWH3a-P1]